MINGIINIYKEKGYTSHDVVAKLRGICKQKKIGHTGTLDPDAEGVLPVCLGNATRLCELLTDKQKEYVATMKLGMITDTQDSSGTILEVRNVNVSEEELRHVIHGFCGQQKQIPPMYSAVKVNGKRLYELARAGIEIERQPRAITIHAIDILSIEKDEVRMKVTCSKGTYIRTLCHDIGQTIGCGAVMSNLCRTKSGNFEIKDALKLVQVETIMKENKIDAYCIHTEDFFSNLERISMKPEFNRFIENGNTFHPLHIQETVAKKDNEEVRVYDSFGKFYAVYKYQITSDSFKPVTMFL